MRLVKDAGEIALIRRAVSATERGLLAGMRAARVGMTERQLREIIEAEFRAAGADGLAFPSIVASGQSSNILHYPAGNRTIRAGDILLCDVGASVGGYASDVTRTFPADGRFNAEQRRVYETVLAAQEAAMAQLRPGAVFEDLHQTASEVIGRAGHIDDFWHGLGHFVGLNVHDVGDLAAPIPVNAVLSIEPGIYQPSRGFGVRIEDNFLVTQSGHEHLSRNVPRRPADIEALLASR
jgi:Xaa-Pro aminopeptidase